MKTGDEQAEETFKSLEEEMADCGLIPTPKEYDGPNDFKDYVGRIDLTEVHSTFQPADHTIISRFMAD